MPRLTVLIVCLVVTLGVAAYVFFKRTPENVPATPVAVKEQPKTQSVAKVVFVKGTALMTADADGSNLKTLVDDGVAKSNPHWSPAGDMIAYETGREIEQYGGATGVTISDLRIVTATGQPLSSIRANTPTEWWFSAAETGWYGNNGVFVAGPVNRFVGGYLAIDMKSGQVVQNLERFSGEPGYQTCSRGAQVAYRTDDRDMWNPSSDPAVVTVEVNGSTIYTVQPVEGKVPFIHDLHWSSDCTRLAFAERIDTQDTLVVLLGKNVEARFKVSISEVVPIGDSFIVHDYPNESLFYETQTHRLRTAPEIVQQLKQRNEAESGLMKTLGGEDPDWYRPAQ